MLLQPTSGGEAREANGGREERQQQQQTRESVGSGFPPHKSADREARVRMSR